MYKYGKSIIKTNLKYEFNNKTSAYNVPIESLHVELIIYNLKRKVQFKDGNFSFSKVYNNKSVNEIIKLLFQKELEDRIELKKGNDYYAVFKAYELRKSKKRVYKPTNDFEDYDRRLGVLTERINFSYI